MKFAAVSTTPDLILFVAYLGGNTLQRDAARATYLGSATASIKSGAAAYRFFVAKEEPESLAVAPHEWSDTVPVSNRILPEAHHLPATLVKAWGVGPRARDDLPYHGPMGRDGRWVFLIINCMRHARALYNFRFLVKAETDGLLCVDAMVETLRLRQMPHASRLNNGLFIGFQRACHFDESFFVFSHDIVAALDEHWERTLVPLLRDPAELGRLWDLQNIRFYRSRYSFFGRYVATILWLFANAHVPTGLKAPWTFSSFRPFTAVGMVRNSTIVPSLGIDHLVNIARRRGYGFIYLHSGLDRSIELQWRHLQKQRERGLTPLWLTAQMNETMQTRACNGPTSMCAMQKLSCKHVFFVHKIKNMSTLHELWQAQLEQNYDYKATALLRMLDLVATNSTKMILHPPKRKCFRKHHQHETAWKESCQCEYQETLLNHSVLSQ
jgi:hypothetical protein